MLFSQRRGLKPVKSVVQTDSMDDDLRNGLWNALSDVYWQNVRVTSYDSFLNEPNSDLNPFVRSLWHLYFKLPLDTVKDNWPSVYQTIRGYFFKAPWHEVYDFLEFTLERYPDRYNDKRKRFVHLCDAILEREVSAYRFVGGKITQITTDEEISAIEEALAVASRFRPVSLHVKRALELLTDRKSPDYRNSIKESISAVEALCRIVAADPKATLGHALKVVKDKVPVHPALEKAFSQLYGFTSDESGIRHALLDAPNVGFEEGKFMLTACSAFVNYLTSKAG